MRLGINGWRLHGQRTGVARYLQNVVRRWDRDLVGDRFGEVNLYTPRPLDRERLDLPGNIRERVLGSDAPMLVWENTRLAAAADDDVVFHPSYSRPLLARGRTVVVSYDAATHLHPELFPVSVRLFYDRLYGWSARRATLVVTMTGAARDEIADCWQVDRRRIEVVRLAPAEVFRPLPDRRPAASFAARLIGVDVPFFLFVGKLSGRRSIPVLLEGFAGFRRGSAPHRLVMVGPGTDEAWIGELAERHGVGAALVRGSYVTDEELNLLYNAATALVMPSVYETISFPVMEAQATGTPVVCVDTPGTRENTGGAALFVPRMAADVLAEALTRVAGDERLRGDLAARGLAHSRELSWSRCSAETLDVLARAAS